MCASLKIAKVGDIAYSIPIIFSTIEISLQYSPELWVCKFCKSKFTQNTIPNKIAADLYTFGLSEKRWVANSFEKAKHPVIVKTLDKLFVKNMHILDVGCNTGELLDYAKIKGCHTSGVEFCKSSRKIIEGKGHQPFSSLDEVFGSYDIITAFDLVEHLYDISFFLDKCKKNLQKNGMIVLLTGDISSISARLTKSNWWYVKHPEHVIFPSKKYFKSCSGFHIEYWIHSYAERYFQKPFLPSFVKFIYGILHKKSEGLPSPGPDHVLIVLKKY